MRISNSGDLGIFVRDERRRLDMTQTDLGAAADVSRRWLSDLETGKATAEVGLVFRVLHALGMVLEVSSASTTDFDLDDVIRAQGQQPSRGHDGGR
jgi:y4mF family transcriptional regulator